MAKQKRASRWADQILLDADHWMPAFGRAAAPRGAAILAPKSVAGDLAQRGSCFRDKAFVFTLVIVGSHARHADIAARLFLVRSQSQFRDRYPATFSNAAIS